MSMRCGECAIARSAKARWSAASRGVSTPSIRAMPLVRLFPRPLHHRAGRRRREQTFPRRAHLHDRPREGQDDRRAVHRRDRAGVPHRPSGGHGLETRNVDGLPAGDSSGSHRPCRSCRSIVMLLFEGQQTRLVRRPGSALRRPKDQTRSRRFSKPAEGGIAAIAGRTSFNSLTKATWSRWVGSAKPPSTTPRSRAARGCQ